MSNNISDQLFLEGERVVERNLDFLYFIGIVLILFFILLIVRYLIKYFSVKNKTNPNTIF